MTVNAARLPEVAFRALAATDFPKLTAWLAEPHVRRFYQKEPVTLEDVAAEYGPVVRADEPARSDLALCGDTPFAYLQCYRNADYPVWGDIIGANDGISIDLFIGDPAFLRKGFGQAALRGYLRDVAFPAYPNETRAFIAHELSNSAALRCSQAVGFRPRHTFFENGIETALLVIDKAA